MVEGNQPSFVDVVVPNWERCNKSGYAAYTIPYLEHKHILSVVHSKLGVLYVLTRESTEVIERIRDCAQWSDLAHSGALDVASIVHLREDGTVKVHADRFGFYPIFYCPGSLKGLKATKIWFDLAQAGVFSGKTSRDYSIAFLAQLNQTFPFDTLTVWEGVFQVAPGWSAEVTTNGITLEHATQLPDAEWHLADLAPRFKKEIQRHLDCLTDTNDAASCDLSGGLDSSYTAAVVSRRVRDLQTVFLEDSKHNVSDNYWAKVLSEQVQSDHRRLAYWENTTIFGASSVKVRERMPFGFDESFRYANLASRLSEMANDYGATVHFNGHGGDELFGPNAAMAWSYYRHGSHSYMTRLRNTLGFARANRFPTAKFLQQVRSETTFLEELQSGVRVSEGLDSEKFDSSWIPAATIPEFVDESLKAELDELAMKLAKVYSEPYSEDRSQHRIAEDITNHVSLLRSMNLMVSDLDTRFVSLFLDPGVISAAMSTSIDSRFMARVLKPLLYETWPRNIPRDVFMRHDKGEYSSATFTEFESSKKFIMDLFSAGSSLASSNLVNTQALLTSINSFSPDGAALDDLMRAAALEAWISER